MRRTFLTDLEQFQDIQRMLGYKPGWLFHKLREVYHPLAFDELQAIGDALGYQPT